MYPQTCGSSAKQEKNPCGDACAGRAAIAARAAVVGGRNQRQSAASGFHGPCCLVLADNVDKKTESCLEQSKAMGSLKACDGDYGGFVLLAIEVVQTQIFL